MRYKLLDVVVLDRDLPDHGLRKDDLGTVVALGTDAIRPVSHHDLIAVRHVRRTA